MRNPYLIQRAKFANTGAIHSRKGIDAILNFDYMGSSEFEWGALPKSLKRIRGSLNDYVHFSYSFKNHPNKSVSVFCKQGEMESICGFLEDLAEDKLRLKEYCDLKDFVVNGQCRSDFWWDIENDWFFWVPKAGFEIKIQNALTNP